MSADTDEQLVIDRLIIGRLTHELNLAKAERDHWKANHGAQVARARILIERNDLPIERVAAYKHMTEMQRDADRYRWLREQDWGNSDLCVVRDPKISVKLGCDCPSLDRLDEAIDQAMGGIT